MLIKNSKEKKFFAKDMSQAMRILSDNFGSDAMILSSRKVSGGVEVIGVSDKDNIFELKKNLSKNKKFTTKDLNPILVFKDEILSTLMNYGFTKRLSHKIVSQLVIPELEYTESNKSKFLDLYLKDCLKIFEDMLSLEQDDLLKEGGIFCFYGARSSGKSAAIAKLAIRKHLSKSYAGATAIISNCKNDDLIKRVSLMTGIPVFFPGKKSSVSDCLDKCSNFNLVLIDMDEGVHGLSNLFPNPHKKLSDKILKNIFVLSALSEYNNLNKLFSLYRGINFSSSIITHMDMAINIFGLFSFIVENDLNISYLSSGELLPKHINLPRKSILAKKFESIYALQPR